MCFRFHGNIPGVSSAFDVSIILIVQWCTVDLKRPPMLTSKDAPLMIVDASFCKSLLFANNLHWCTGKQWNKDSHCFHHFKKQKTNKICNPTIILNETKVSRRFDFGWVIRAFKSLFVLNFACLLVWCRKELWPLHTFMWFKFLSKFIAPSFFVRVLCKVQPGKKWELCDPCTDLLQLYFCGFLLHWFATTIFLWISTHRFLHWFVVCTPDLHSPSPSYSCLFPGRFLFWHCFCCLLNLHACKMISQRSCLLLFSLYLIFSFPLYHKQFCNNFASSSSSEKINNNSSNNTNKAEVATTTTRIKLAENVSEVVQRLLAVCGCSGRLLPRRSTRSSPPFVQQCKYKYKYKHKRKYKYKCKYKRKLRI